MKSQTTKARESKCLAPFSRWLAAAIECRTTRFCAVTPVLIFSLALPSSSLALRASGLEENAAKKAFLHELGISAGLEERRWPSPPLGHRDIPQPLMEDTGRLGFNEASELLIMFLQGMGTEFPLDARPWLEGSQRYHLPSAIENSAILHAFEKIGPITQQQRELVYHLINGRYDLNQVVGALRRVVEVSLDVETHMGVVLDPGPRVIHLKEVRPFCPDDECGTLGIA